MYKEYATEYYIFKNGKNTLKYATIKNIVSTHIYDELLKKIALNEGVHQMYVSIINYQFKKQSNKRMTESI